ncbi:MAG TPA: M48 family metallopeptidase [Thermoanaerobaculia bacterium]|jgi:predicted Zn-dependent protease|nr:M48 family metallopeptidase [Thermoanaerobaculia bacterium]
MKSKPRAARLAHPSVLAVVLVLTLAGGATAAFNLVSVDQEWSMRDDMRKQVSSEMRVVNDPEAVAYLNRIGRRIADQTPYGNRRWDFGIVQDDTLNAFNLPGGLVYVNTGLIAEADSLDQLAGVLAHEIGHGAERHGTQLMTRAYGYNLIAGLALGRNPSMTKQVLGQLVGTGVINSYSRGAENQADQLGVHYAYQAGYDPRGMVQFFEQMERMQSSRPGKVAEFFSNHPSTSDRLERISREAQTLPRRASLVHDTRDFQRFRSRFR